MNTINLIVGKKYKDIRNHYNNLVYGGSYDKLDYRCDSCGKNLSTNNCYEFATFANEKILADLIKADGTINIELWSRASGYYHYGSECVKRHIVQVD